MPEISQCMKNNVFYTKHTADNGKATYQCWLCGEFDERSKLNENLVAWFSILLHPECVDNFDISE